MPCSTPSAISTPQGSSIGTLDRNHILAVGDRIKLSTADIRPAAGPADSAEDIRAL